MDVAGGELYLGSPDEEPVYRLVFTQLCASARPAAESGGLTDAAAASEKKVGPCRPGPLRHGMAEELLQRQRDDCVDVAVEGEVIAVRDSKDPAGPALVFVPSAWWAFLATAPAGTRDGGVELA